MGYRFEPGESVDEGVRRICLEQIEKTVAELTDHERTDDARVESAPADASSADDAPAGSASAESALALQDGVHRARKRFKKIRGMLRLVRPALGDTYSAENAWFRDEARRFSRVRDAAALVETIDALREVYAEQADAAFLARVRQALDERRERIAQEEVDLAGRVDELVASLGEAARRVHAWTLQAEEYEAIGPGLAKTYKRGRAALDDAYAEMSAEAFHDLRKRAKYHRFHARALRPVWPRVMKAYRKAVKQLTDVLGDNQDLAVLREAVLADPHGVGDARDVQALLAIVDRRQAELRSLAEPLARKVFAESPSAIEDRIGSYWSAWRGAESQEPSLAAPA